MSYAVQPQPVAVPPVGRRPAAVTMAVVLLWAMAAAGLTYAIGMVAVTPGVVGRLREAAPGSETAESFITVIWLVAALAPVLSTIFLAIVVVLGIALRRGNRLAWSISLGVCGIGLLAGLGTLAVLAAQRAGGAAPGTVSEALNEAYPSGWIVLNVAVAAAQVVAYLVVGALLLSAPREHFGSAPILVSASQLVVPVETSQWAAPQTKTFVTGGSEPDQFSGLSEPSESQLDPEGEYWSRPRD